MFYFQHDTFSWKFFFFQVFSAFGFVHKITTFEKTAGFQVFLFAWVSRFPSLWFKFSWDWNAFYRLWCNFLMQKLLLLQRIPLMEEAFPGDVGFIFGLGMLPTVVDHICRCGAHDWLDVFQEPLPKGVLACFLPPFYLLLLFWSLNVPIFELFRSILAYSLLVINSVVMFQNRS